MTSAELQVYVKGARLLRRDEGSAEYATLVLDAINEGKLLLQRGTDFILRDGRHLRITGDWPCMFAKPTAVYVADGIDLTAITLGMETLQIKRILKVKSAVGWNVKSYTGTTKASAEILMQRGQLDPAATVGTNESARTWFQEGQKLVILPEPTGSTQYLELYRYLADFTADDDTDWFSEFAWDVVATIAAAIVKRGLKHYDDAAALMTEAAGKVQDLWLARTREGAASIADGMEGQFDGSGSARMGRG